MPIHSVIFSFNYVLTFYAFQKYESFQPIINMQPKHNPWK